MKKIYTLIIAACSFTTATAQNANAIVFSELGEKFTLYLNGVQQNSTPQANVKVTGLTGEFMQARIDFEDATKADFAENNFRIAQGIEVTYMVKLNKKAAYVLRYAGEASISSTTATNVNTNTTVTDDSKRLADVDNETDTKVTNTTNTTVGDTDEVTVVETTTTTTGAKGTTDGKPATKGEKVSVGMNIGGINMGVNVNVEETGEDGDMTMDQDVKVNSTTTTTTTTKTNTNNTTTKPREDVVVVEKVTGCGSPMSASAFATAKKNIADKGFDETRLSTAKTILKANCMSAAQIKEVCDTFGFEETKLDFAKYAYDYCSDTGNYFVVNETFGFSSSTDELNEYILSK
ncbi:MAG: DUF4476 domain-containing protein [Flavobacteriales bacterium]